MEELEEMIKNFWDIELTNDEILKIDGHATVGKEVSIKWVDREYLDTGYSFRFPNQDDDDDIFDICLHVTNVDNSDGIGDSPEEWMHLTYLLTNERVESITFKK